MVDGKWRLKGVDLPKTTFLELALYDSIPLPPVYYSASSGNPEQLKQSDFHWSSTITCVFPSVL